MASSVPLLTPYNFHTWKNKMETQLHSKGLYRVAMDTEVEPGSAIEKSIFLNKKDEAFGFLCLSIFDDLLFHLTDLKTPKQIWDKLEYLYGKHDDMRVYQLENELMSLQPSNLETLNDFFTKFKNTVFLLKQCKVEKEDDQLILAILSKLEADYSVFVSTFHAGKLTNPGWKIYTQCLH